MKNMMNRPPRDFLAGNDRRCDRYEMADEKAYASIRTTSPPQRSEKEIMLLLLFVCASPGRDLGYGDDKPREPRRSYVICCAKLVIGTTRPMFALLEGLLSPTDRKDTDQLNPCEES